jgi:hypothetical protein
MKQALLLTILCTLISAPALADKVAEAKFRSKSPVDQVYAAALRTITLQGYSVKFTDQAHGTIQANKQAWGGYGEFASVIVTVTQSGEQVTVSVLFTKHSGTLGGGKPKQWAEKFGRELRKSLPDLENVT